MTNHHTENSPDRPRMTQIKSCDSSVNRVGLEVGGDFYLSISIRSLSEDSLCSCQNPHLLLNWKNRFPCPPVARVDWQSQINVKYLQLYYVSQIQSYWREVVNASVSSTHTGVQLNMFSYTGQLVESVYVGDFEYNYSFEGLEHLENGVYFLQMKSADGRLDATQRVVKY